MDTAPQVQNLHNTTGDPVDDSSGVSSGSSGRWIDTVTYRLAMTLARHVIRYGDLTIYFRDERPLRVGGGSNGPEGSHVEYKSAIRIESARFLKHILTAPDLAVGDGYVDGEWKVVRGDLARVLGMLLVNDDILRQRLPLRWLSRIAQRLADPHKTNDPRKSRRNVAHHYDIGNDLYRVFLDAGMNYSCAFFEHPDQELRYAQLNKLRTSIQRLQVEPGMFVLDIGCGWGELTRLITLETRAQRVVGITLAEEQCKLARSSIAPNEGDRLNYQLEDYRHHAACNPATYDRIISIGMFEHVGKHHFIEFFRAIDTLLKPGGIALIHAIIRPGPSFTSPWVDKYIFPGGYIPSLGEMTGSAAAVGLVLSAEPFIHDSFHYANTLRHWRRRFNNGYESLDHSHYDERFRRMWNFYLAGSEAAFKATGFRVAQIRVKKLA